MIPATPRMLVELGLLGLLALLWGSSYLFVKVSVQTIAPITLIAARVAIASVFLLLVMRWTHARLPRDRRTWRLLFVQAVFNSIGAWTLLAWGQQYVDSALASVLNSTSPIFVWLFTCLTRHEPSGARPFVGAVLGLSGVVLIIGPVAMQGLGQQALAEAAIVLGAILYAGAAIFGMRLAHLPPLVSATGTMLWATACLVPACLVLEHPWLLRPSAASVGATGVLGIACTGLALMLYFRLLGTLGSLGVASQSYLRAAVGVALGVLLLREQVSLAAGAGIIAALLGVIVINARPRRTPSRPAASQPPTPRNRPGARCKDQESQ